MAFSDNPIIDKNAERSEESILAVRQLMNLKSKMICREESPDYGVDLVIELIDIKSGASAKQFAIQVKSTERGKTIIVSGESYLTLKFKTSRLGYIARRNPPSYGLIVFYNEETKKCYFDYIEDIISRVVKVRSNELWKNNESVTIHIPLENILNTESVEEIYEKYKRRFENVNALLSNHGSSYSLPFVKDEATSLFSIENFEQDIGVLINEQKFNIICRAIKGFGYDKVRRYKRITLFGAYAFSEIGQIFDAKYFLSLCKIHINDFDDFEKEILIFINLKVSFLSGDMSVEELGEFIEEHLPKIKNLSNITNLRLNLFHYKISEIILKKKYDEEFEKELLDFFEEIENTIESERGQQRLILQHCDIVAVYLSSVISRALTQHKLQKFTKTFSVENNNLILRAQNLSKELTIRIYNAVSYAEKVGDILTKAEGYFHLGRMFIHRQFSYALVDETPPLSKILEDDYKLTHIRLKLAYNNFIENEKFHEAYLTIYHILDLRSLYRVLYGKVLTEGDDDESLKSIAENIRKEMNFKPYESTIENGIASYREVKEEGLFEFLKTSSEEKLIAFAEQIQKSYGLPIDRFDNILLDLKNYQKFAIANKNQHIVMLQNNMHAISPDTYYKFKPTYILKSIKTGVQTPPSNNIDELLKMFNHLLKISD